MPESRERVAQLFSKGPLVFDGAMGTVLYERGQLYTQNFDALSETRPDLIREVHQSYVQAGADVIQTNSFGANRFRLRAHGIEARVESINRSAVRVASEVAAASTRKVSVAGSIGPSGLMLKSMQAHEYAELEDAFAEQASALLDEGVDLLVLETFRQTDEIEVALRALDRVRGGRDVPVVASVSFDTFGTMSDGKGPELIAARLRDAGAHILGVNCADGPAGVFEMAIRMLDAGLPVIAQPNAGLPRRVDGRFAYMATPEYFLVYAKRMLKAGVRGVGGCCGTTHEHIRQLVAAARMLSASLQSEEGGGGMREERDSGLPAAQPVSIAPGARLVETREKSDLGAKLGHRFVVSVEVNPPPGLSLKKALDGARLLKDGGVDVVNVADGARATARMGNFALCHRVQEEVGMEAIMHVTTRDRNLLGLVAHLLGCHELGLRNLVVITGDPPKMGDFPDATPVYDLDSIGLLRLINGMNRGFDPGGKPLGSSTEFLCATGAEPAAHDYEREVRRLRKKVEAGAEFVMTQPVYDPVVLDKFLTDISDLKVPVLVGILPLASYRNAEFLHNEVPGMSVPNEIRERMRLAGTGEEARKEGVRIAREMLHMVKDRVAGAYIMPPFGRFELAVEVIQGVVR